MAVHLIDRNTGLVVALATTLVDGEHVLAVSTPDTPADGGVWALSGVSAAATAQTLTQAGVAGQRHAVSGYLVSLSGADATTSITVTVRRGATVLWRDRFGPSAIRGDRVGFAFPSPLQAGDGEAVSLEVTAGSAGVVTEANLTGITR